ncbi:MAG: divalent-cation tolerance protein CutA [candidate division Zixibacteria bacterium]
MSNNANDLIIIFVTCASDEEAKKLSDGLISRNLAACVNIAPVGSVFRWKGKIENQAERLMIIKSIKSNFDEIEKFVKASHSYDCPEIIAMKIEAASADYAAWVHNECQPDEDKGED